MKTTPRGCQMEAYEKSNTHDAFAYFMEMGMGKSKVLLDDAARAFERGDIESLVILAPKGVYRNWERYEIPAHLAVNHSVSVWSSEHGVSKREAELGRFNRRYSEATLRIFLMNIEALSTEQGQKWSKKIVGAYASMLVIDESTAIKAPGSKRTKASLRLAPLAKMRRILTGSPIANKPFDMYAQAKFLNPALLGFDSFVVFKNFYANIIQINAGGRAFPKLLGYKNLEDLNRRIKPWSYRALKKDWLDLPPKIYMSRDVELTPEQASAYKSMYEAWLVEMRDGACTVTLALVRLMRLHQIVCGHITDDNKVMQVFPQNRTAALLDVIEETTGASIIFAKYRQDVVNIRAALVAEHGPDSVVEFHGMVGDTERLEAVEKFQTEKARFFLGSYAAAKGLTLTAASNVIYYSYDYDKEMREQSEDRAHRIGQTKSVNIIDLKVRGTIDEVILASHKSKKAIAEIIMDLVKVALD